MPYMICSRALLRLRRVGDEVEEVVGLPVEAERVEAPQHERGVADPGVAVVPVALAAGRLGQRGGGRRHHRAGRRVGQALQRERAALEERAPRVVGEARRGRASAASGAPSRPAGGRPRRRCVGGGVLAPRERDEQRLALLDQRAGRWRAAPRSRGCRSVVRRSSSVGCPRPGTTALW